MLLPSFFVTTTALTPVSQNRDSRRLLEVRATTGSTFLSNEVEILEGISEPFEQAQWMMPTIVERALIHQETVDPFALLERLDMSSYDREEAIVALERHDAVITIPILTPPECKKLIDFVNKQIRDDGVDDVDGCPDWQVNLNEKKLGKIVGKDVIKRLWAVPSILDPEAKQFSRVGVFIRKYERGARPWMPFHKDDNRWTVNVALNGDNEFVGGRLMALHNRALQLIERKEGDATCHEGRLYHGVSAIRDGTRYSMIMFFHQKP